MKKAAPAGKEIDGIIFPANISDFHAHLWLFRHAQALQANPTLCPMKIPENWNPRSSYCGTGRYSHCRILIEMLFPSFEWHDWSERQIEALCSHSAVAMSGAGGSGKSTSTAAYAWIFALCGMYDESTSVRIASTTISAAMGRIWKNIAEFYSEMRRRTGQLGELQIYGKPIPEVRASPTDFAHGIFVTPVAQGEIQKAIDRLKGKHAARILLIGDETDSISQAIVDVQDNISIGCDEFQAVWLGNLPSMFNPLGKIMELAINQPVSESLGTEWTSSTGVHCMRFDGEDSPNLRDNDKWKGIIRQRDIDAILRRNHGVKGQQYWIMVKGLPPPEGVDDTVLSEATLNRFHVWDQVTWMRDYVTSAALDPGFGGDPCMLRLYMRGLDTEGNLKLMHGLSVPIPVDATDKANPAEFQIAEKTIAICNANSIDPTEFIIGSTGIGRGTAAVIQHLWSASIEKCEENGATTTKPVSNEDQRPSNEVYDRLVTELWFSTREFISADMIRGMDNATARELCSRKWEYKGAGAGKRISIEKKEDMKARGIASPNNGDCLGFYCCLLRRKGINAESAGAPSEAASAQFEAEADSYDFQETYA